MSDAIDYSKWQPIAHTGMEGDQQRDLDSAQNGEGFWAEIGPEGPDAGWSWTILVASEGDSIAGGFTDTEEEAKQAVQAWDDQTRRAE